LVTGGRVGTPLKNNRTVAWRSRAWRVLGYGDHKSRKKSWLEFATAKGSA